MTQTQLLLCALVGGVFTAKSTIINCDCTNFVPFTFSWLLGLIMGDAKTGLIIGATIQTLNMAPMLIGGVQTMNMWFAAVICVPLVIGSGMSLEMAMVLAGPLSVLYVLVNTVVDLIVCDIIANPVVEKRCKNADWKKLAIDELVLFYIPRFLIFTTVCYVSLAGGEAIIDVVVDKIPDWLNAGMSATAGILPAVGFALFLYVMGSKKYLPFFFIGFYCVYALKFGNILVGIIGAAIGIIYLTIIEEAKGAKKGGIF